MANYPASVYSPRTKSNKVGVVYTPLVPTTLFAEDISLLDAEVVAIETDLIAKIDQAVKSSSSPTFNALTVTSIAIGANVLTTSEFGYLDGIDQAVKTTSSPTFNALTVTSIAIGANVLTTSEFGYLDGQNQAVKSSSSPTFAGLTVTNDILRGSRLRITQGQYGESGGIINNAYWDGDSWEYITNDEALWINLWDNGTLAVYSAPAGTGTITWTQNFAVGFSGNWYGRTVFNIGTSDDTDLMRLSSGLLAINGGLNVGADTNPGDNNLSVAGSGIIIGTFSTENICAVNGAGLADGVGVMSIGSVSGHWGRQSHDTASGMVGYFDGGLSFGIYGSQGNGDYAGFFSGVVQVTGDTLLNKALINVFNYGVDNQASDSYIITLSPAPVAYTTGMMITFYAKTINTGAATLNVNNLGAKTIVKRLSTALANGDILAGMTCVVVYDGTNFILINPVVN